MSQKDHSIIEAIELLRLKYGNSNIHIQDYWESDNYAIGICDLTKKYLVYISTYLMKKGRYYVALENPPNNSSLPYSPAGEFDDITLEELFKLVFNHLKLQIN